MDPLALDLIFTIIASLVLIVLAIVAIYLLYQCYVGKIDETMIRLALRLWTARK